MHFCLIKFNVVINEANILSFKKLEPSFASTHYVTFQTLYGAQPTRSVPDRYPEESA